MRVAWVHPSWRDLVIEHLSDHPGARRQFLSGCSIHGALLALSTGGGHTGARRLPLLRDDGDWDALTDRVYELVPELESAELIGLLDGVGAAVDSLGTSAAGGEVDALARALLTRVSGLWNQARTPIVLTELESWFAVARLLSPRPATPSVAVTWTELLPTVSPAISDYTSLERFADWLTLADLLDGYDRDLLNQLGFPGPSAQFALDLCQSIAIDEGGQRTCSPDQASRALHRISRLFPPLTHRAADARYWLGEQTRHEPPVGSSQWTFELQDSPQPRSGERDIRRVLRDL